MEKGKGEQFEAAWRRAHQTESDWNSQWAKNSREIDQRKEWDVITEKNKGVGGPTKGWERGGWAFHTVSTDKPATQPMAWSKCDKCSQTPSESASRSSTPSKANVMATHKLKSPWARFIHTPTHKHFISLKTYFPPFYSHCILLLQQDLTPFQNECTLRLLALTPGEVEKCQTQKIMYFSNLL